MSQLKIDRRNFVKWTAGGTGALVLGIAWPGSAAAAAWAGDCEHFQPNAFLRIDTSGKVTLFYGKQESGQGVNTSLPMIVAEELDVDFDQIQVEAAPYGTLPAGAHDTGGSQSVTGTFDELRKAGAIARAMLISAAAKKWNCEAALCKTDRGRVLQQVTNQYLEYKDLVCDAALLPVPETITLKQVTEFKVIGKDQRKRNQREILTGKIKYGMDLVLPGMVYAAVERCPVFGGKLVQFDDTQAIQVPGVVKIVVVKGSGAPMHARMGVAVVATNSWAALKARELLKITWDEGEAATADTDALFKKFATRALQKPASVVYTKGQPDSVKVPPTQELTADYTAPFLAHAAMEPINFIAKADKDHCELWGGLQLPDWAVSAVAKDCGIPQRNIKLNLQLMGGAFGRRLLCDFAIEAVQIAQQLDVPVKLVWDRNDDIRFDQYRPANHHRMKAAWDASGKLLRWEHHVLTTPIGTSLNGPDAKNIEENLGGAGADFWYEVPHVRTAYSPVEFPLPRGWVRGVEPVVNVFALECFIDEVARKLKKDPLDYRLSLLENRPPFDAKFSENWSKKVDPSRMAAVLKLAGEKIGWKQKRKPNHFVGIAAHLFFCDSYAAHAIEIEMLAPKKFRLVKIVCTIDCGLVVNPDGLLNQMEGGTVFGLGQALRNEITVKNGRVEQEGFFGYELARFSDIPPLEVHIIPSQENPGGAGEVGVATVAPALCNALAAAGARPRRLPLKKEGYTWSV